MNKSITREVLKRCYKEGVHAFKNRNTMFDNPYNAYKQSEWSRANQWVIGYMEAEMALKWILIN